MGSLLIRRGHAANAPGGALANIHKSSFRPYDDPDKLKGSEILKVFHAVHVKHSALMELKRQAEASQADVQKLASAAQASHADWSQVQTMLQELQAEHEQQLLEVEKELQKSELERQAKGKRNTELEQQLAAEKEQLANIKDAKGAAEQTSKEAVAEQQRLQEASIQAQQTMELQQMELQQQLQGLKQELAKTQGQQQDFQSETVQQREHIARLQDELAEGQQAYSTLASEKVSLVTEQEAAQKAATESDRRHAEQQQVLQQDLQTQLDSAAEHLSTQEKESRDKLASLQDEVAALKAAADHAQNQAATERQELEQHLKSSIRQELHEEFEEERKNEAVAEQQQLQDAFAQAQQTMKLQQMELQQQLQGLQQELAKTQGQQQDFHSETVQQREHIARLQDELAGGQQAYNTLAGEKVSLVTELEAAQKAATESDRRHAEQQQVLQQDLQTQLNSAADDIARLQDELAEGQQAYSTLASEKVSLVTEHEAAQKAATESDRRHAEQQQVLQQDLQTQLDSAAEHLSTQEESRDKLALLQDEVAALKAAADHAQNQAATERQELEQHLKSSIRQELQEEFEEDWKNHLQEVESDKQQQLQQQKDSATHVFSRNEEVRNRQLDTVTAHYQKELKQAEADRVQQVTHLQQQINRLRHAEPDSPHQAKRKRTTAQAHPRRSSATPKRAELKIEDAGPSTAALPAQQMGDDAQQDELQMESSQGGATARSPAGTAAGSPAWEAEGMHAGSGHQSDVHEREAPKTLASRISRFAGIFIGRKTTPDTPTGGIEEAEAEQAGPSQPAATQAEEAQGSDSAQEELPQPEAPLAADSNQSRVKATRGRGRSRGRGRGRGSSSRPAVDRKSNIAAVHGTKNPENAPGSSEADPPKRGRGRPRGSSRAAAASSAAAAPANPAGADADTEGQHVAAPEPAGPAEDAAHVQGPQTRQRRTASVSQATGAAAAEADDVSTPPNADTSAAAVQSDAPKARRGSKVQSEALKSRRGRSRSSSSVSQFKQDTVGGGIDDNPAAAATADAPSRATRAASRSRASSAAAEMQDTAGTRAGRRKRKPQLDAIAEEEEEGEKDVQITKRARTTSHA